MLKPDAEAIGRFLNPGDGLLKFEIDIALAHLVQKHPDNILGAVITKQLAQRLFMPRDAIGIDLSDEILRV